MDRDQREQAIVAFFFLLPDALGLLLFLILPMLLAFSFSLTDWRLVTPPQFVGLRNFFRISADPLFAASLGRTLLYTISFVPTVYFFSLGIAILLTRRSRSNTFFRTVYFMPVAMSLLVAGVTWRFLLDPDAGLINALFAWVGLPRLHWAGSVQTAMISVLIPAIWKNVGYFMIILLAGIQDIPKEYIEAARLDGASTWQIYRRVIMPLLKPVSFFVIVILTIGALQTFDQVYVMTQGGPAYATYTLLIYIYEKGFKEWNLGYASALSVVLFAIIFALTLIQVRYFRADERPD
ncbi:MAG: sugar ABC transporter permease [Verrucomicrobia bacterium]|nr:sugar ABC transporter permease [Verrucomicrobiota bacterium]